MDKQMCWLFNRHSKHQFMVLHLREYAYQPWKPYNTSKYSVPDYRIPRGSKGWATYQHLRQAGWNLIPTAQANNYSPSIHNLAKKAA